MNEILDKKIKFILKVPVCITCVLIIAKFIIYKISGSLAIFSLVADSFFDFIGSLVSLVAYKYSMKDKTDKHQYGFYGIIDIITIFISATILCTSFFIFYRSIMNIINKNIIEYSASSVLVMFISSLASIILATILKNVYKKTKLIVIKGEIAHYAADGLTNGGVLLSILICKFVYNHYLIDPIIAIIMGFIVAKPAFEILFDAINNILSKEIDSEIKEKIINIVKQKESVLGYHSFKTRRSGERIFIQMYIEIKKNLAFEMAHDIVENLENEIEKNIENSEIIIHACPK